MNNVVISGRLTRDAQIRNTKNGNPYATFTVAVPDTWNREKTYFINCKAFGNVVANISKYTGKGKRVNVMGSLETREYKKRDGSKGIATEVNVEIIDFIDFKDAIDDTPDQDQEEWGDDLF